jgi:hypothetical protein
LERLRQFIGHELAGDTQWDNERPRRHESNFPKVFR